MRERKSLASRGNEAAAQIGKTTDRYVRAIASPDARGLRARLRSCVLTCIRGQQCGKDGCATTPLVMRLMRPPLCRTVSPSAYGDRERFWDARYRDRRGTLVVNNKRRNTDHLTSAVSLRSLGLHFMWLHHRLPNYCVSSTIFFKLYFVLSESSKRGVYFFFLLFFISTRKIFQLNLHQIDLPYLMHV